MAKPDVHDALSTPMAVCDETQQANEACPNDSSGSGSRSLDSPSQANQPSTDGDQVWIELEDVEMMKLPDEVQEDSPEPIIDLTDGNADMPGPSSERPGAAMSPIEDEGSIFFGDDDDLPELENFSEEPTVAGARESARHFQFMGGLDIEEDNGSNFSMSEPSEVGTNTPSHACCSEKKQSTETTSPASTSTGFDKLSLDTTTQLRDILTLKQATTHLSEDENQQLQLLQELAGALSQQQEQAEGPGTPALIATSKSRRRRKPAKNIREFIRHKRERELEKAAAAASKRPNQAKSQLGRVKKTSAKVTRDAEELRKKRAELFSSLRCIETSVKMGTVPAMASFHARTAKEQLAKIVESIPEGGDTRRQKTQRRDLLEARKVFGNRKVKAVDGDWQLVGMRSHLKSYQLTAAAWMAKRELAETAPFGGLLADVMGMGKTVVTLACVVGNPPQDDDLGKYSEATLVVVPNAVTADQWHQEVQKHCDEPVRGRVTRYSTTAGNPISYYANNHSIVITTYFEVARQYPKTEELAALKLQCKGKTESFERELNQRLGDLFQINWYRVVLDEAHEIKNRSTLRHQSCCQLSAKYHWALSGTPLANSKREFYPYLKFLGCKFTANFRTFNSTYVNGPNADQNFDALAALVMYRRTLNDTFLGCRILELPPSSSHDLWISLSQEEAIIYKSVQTYYTRRAFLVESREGEGVEVSRELAQIFGAGFTRLRQAVSHPFGLEKVFRESFRRDDVNLARERLANVSVKKSLINQMLQKDVDRNYLQPFAKGLEALESQGQPIFGGIFDMHHLMELIENGHEVKDIECPKCGKCPPVEPMRSLHCKHIYCQRCLMDLALTSLNQGKASKCLGSRCKATISTGDDVKTLNCVHLEDSMNGRTVKAGRDSQQAAIARKPAEDSFFTACQLQGYSPPPSSKLTAAMALVATWLMEAPNDKIILFTAWLSSAKVLGQMLEQMYIPFYYLMGSVTSKQRTKAVQGFNEDPDKKVLLTSLRSGGQSLNLTAANRVIIIDPWWNKTLESQAFGRVLRHGQDKVTHLVRIWTRTPIDRMIHDLQEKKISIIDKALQDDGHSPRLPDPQVLKQLFTPDLGE